MENFTKGYFTFKKGCTKYINISKFDMNMKINAKNKKK